jgi:hypothetical protein
MKKLGIIATLLAAGVVVASGLFAQDIKFGGYVNSGLGLVISNEGDAPDPFIVAQTVDSWNSSFRIYLDANYTNANGNAGANLRLRASAGHNFLSVPIGYGWFKAFNDILHVKAGIVDDATWHGGGFWFLGDAGEGLGALVRATPITGLDLGVGAYFMEVPGEDAGNSQFSESGNSHNPAGANRNYARDLDEAKYTFSVGYTLPDMVKFIATYRPKSQLTDDDPAHTSSANVTSYVASKAHLAASLLAVPGLKAVLDVELNNLQDFKALKSGEEDAWGRVLDSPAIVAEPTQTPPVYAVPRGPSATAASGKISIGETFEYKLMDNNLTLGLWGVQWMSMAEDSDLSFIVNPWASYALGSIIPRLDLAYGGGVQVQFKNTNLNWRRGAYTAMYDTDYSVISIRPSVRFQIDPNTHVEIGDLINIDGNKKADANGTVGWKGADSRMTNVFYVDFKWSF